MPELRSGEDWPMCAVPRPVRIVPAVLVLIRGFVLPRTKYGGAARDDDRVEAANNLPGRSDRRDRGVADWRRRRRDGRRRRRIPGTRSPQLAAERPLYDRGEFVGGRPRRHFDGPPPWCLRATARHDAPGCDDDRWLPARSIRRSDPRTPHAIQVAQGAPGGNP